MRSRLGVMFVPVGAWLCDEEALYTAHGQPCRGAPPPATHAAMTGRVELPQIATHNVNE